MVYVWFSSETPRWELMDSLYCSASSSAIRQGRCQEGEIVAMLVLVGGVVVVVVVLVVLVVV